MKDTLWFAVLSGFIRQLFYVAIGAATTFVNTHPEIFGVSVDWATKLEWMANAAALLAFAILSWFSARPKVKAHAVKQSMMVTK